MAVAIVSGVVASAVLALFQVTLTAGRTLLDASGLPPIVVGVVGAFAVGIAIYRIAPDAAGEGIPAYITHLNRYGSKFPLGTTIAKLIASAMTFLCYGSGGLLAGC